MIAAVRGVLESTGPDWVQVQVGGVILQALVPPSYIAALGEPGAQIYLHTHLLIRDDRPALYGFPTKADLDAFLLLMGVSGVGPRHSLGLLSSLGVAGLQQAIEQEDLASLSAAPGIGRRTAGRVVLELKGKLEAGEDAGGFAPASRDGEVVDALVALGYSTTEARRVVNRLKRSPEDTVEEQIRSALQLMGGG